MTPETTTPRTIAPRVLVAEDEAGLRQSLAIGLKARGYTVETTTNGLFALELLATKHFDVLVTDIVMPGMDGVALALQAGDLHPTLPIVMMTGYPDERQRAVNLKALIAAVLPKPFSLDLLDQTLRSVLESPAP
jgi:DNA-binding NtrC family response regulator